MYISESQLKELKELQTLVLKVADMAEKKIAENKRLKAQIVQLKKQIKEQT